MKKNVFYKVASIVMVGVMCLLAGCSGNSDSKDKLVIGYQYGMAYAPALIMQQHQLVEQYCGDDVTVEWKVLANGTAMNEGIVSGDLDVVMTGVPPFLTGREAGVPYKIYSAISAQPMGLTTNDPDIKSLADFTPEDKIATNTIGSISHIVLAMACEQQLGDAHALDGNLVTMSHPDGVTSLMAGTEGLAGHMTTAPYYNQEAATEGMHVIISSADVYDDAYSMIIGAAAESLYEDHKGLYDAVVSATADAMNYIADNPDEVAQVLSESEEIDIDTMKAYLSDESCDYESRVVGVLKMAKFMEETGFMEKAPTDFSEIAFDGVEGD